LRIIPTIAALISASLLAYFVLSAQRSQSYAQLQPPPQQEAKWQLAQHGPQPSTPERAKPQPKTPTAPPLSMPSDDVLVMLIRSTLIGLNQANTTGNYTVFREIGAPGFQGANSTAKLTEIFANLRHRNIDMSVILLMQPKLLRKPTINAEGMLRVTGFFPTQPLQVDFDLVFQPVEARWRLFGISVGTSPAQPMAIEPQPVPAQTPNPSPAAAAQAPAVPQPTPSAPKPPEKPKTEGDGDSATTPPSKPQVDIRDRLAVPTPQP
jgi:hypothetical protein